MEHPARRHGREYSYGVVLQPIQEPISSSISPSRSWRDFVSRGRFIMDASVSASVGRGRARIRNGNLGRLLGRSEITFFISDSIKRKSSSGICRTLPRVLATPQTSLRSMKVRFGTNFLAPINSSLARTMSGFAARLAGHISSSFVPHFCVILDVIPPLCDCRSRAKTLKVHDVVNDTIANLHSLQRISAFG